MISILFDDVAAKDHFVAIKNIIQDRIANILSRGINRDNLPVALSAPLRAYLQSLRSDLELEKLITARPESFGNIITNLSQRFPYLSDENFVLYNIFITSCYEKSKKFSKFSFIQRINRDTCVYCNRNYTYCISSPTGEIKPEIDHFFPKTIYPFLGMSFYNLIPSCQVCNGFGAKEQRDPLTEGLVNPYLLKTSDFRFTYKPVSGRILASLLDKSSIEIQFVKEIPGHLSVFKLKELYKQHADHVLELIIKSKVKYAQTYRNYLRRYSEKGLRFSDNEIDRMILGNYSTEDDLHKRPLGKLYWDIGRELGLIK
ncbi:hypothetical protein HGH93_05990 [Chitinophaga polysaccharea]|uniref:hypothetical protein n=1 Tax=Chitinophaga polysaccharea TaxID=1293035 RepID=UPI0014551FE0|nr:hypothetical protein [Chitinophaga polysaccharea]NLR57639.1 hypothetical protein [Chitinophaga polysaccharea]